jgi:hypothetical protein
VITASYSYRPQVYPGRLTLFRNPLERLEPGQGAEYGWSGMALGGLDIVEVSASHLDMPEDPMVAAELRKRISDATLSPGLSSIYTRIPD